MSQTLLTNTLIKKLILAFMAILLLAGTGYTLATLVLTNRYYAETTQAYTPNLPNI